MSEPPVDAPQLKPLNSDRTRSPLKWIITGGLVLLALVVIVILPGRLSEPLLVIETQPEQPLQIETPLSEAKKAEFRRSAQKLLQEILQQQRALNAQGVTTWAPNRMAEAEKSLDSGEKLYARGDYEAAMAAYQQAASQFGALENLAKNTLRDALASGREALAEYSQTEAVYAFGLALTIAPDNIEAQQGLTRAKALPQTTPLLEKAEQQLAAEQYSAAIVSLEQLLAIDAAHPDAQALLATARQQAQQQRFTRAMSEGYSALAAGNFSIAREAFTRAQSIAPNSGEPATALAQVDTEQEQRSVNQTLLQARSLEQQEQWQAALDLYTQLLADDPSLTPAKVAKIPAQVRADLDKKMVDTLAEPLKLGNDRRYAAARALLNDARTIDNPGPRLRDQINRLDDLLLKARTAFAIELVSDQQTQVEIFRVGELGQFAQKVVNLRPGVYTAAGHRKGYRDVQVEFVVDGSPLDPIAIVCSEPI